jgi:hypothetical protein
MRFCAYYTILSAGYIVYPVIAFEIYTFATLAIQGGASIEFVSEALSHSDIKTTRGYFAGFADTTKKDILEGLMDF